MAELGIIASVVQIADVGLRLSIKLYAFGETVASADTSVLSMSKDVSLTSSVLKELGQILDKDRESGLLSETAVQTANGIVKECLKVFRQMDTRLVKKLPNLSMSKCERKGGKRSSPFQLLERLNWSYLQPRLLLLQSNLDRLKSTLLLMLNVITYARQRSGKADSPSVIAEQKLLIEFLDQSNRKYIRKYERLKLGVEAPASDEENNTWDEVGTHTVGGTNTLQSTAMLSPSVKRNFTNITGSDDAGTRSLLGTGALGLANNEHTEQDALILHLGTYVGLLNSLLRDLDEIEYEVSVESLSKIHTSIYRAHQYEMKFLNLPHDKMAQAAAETPLAAGVQVIKQHLEAKMQRLADKSTLTVLDTAGACFRPAKSVAKRAPDRNADRHRDESDRGGRRHRHHRSGESQDDAYFEVFEGYAFTKHNVTHDSPKKTWAFVLQTQMPVSQDDLRREVDKQVRKGGSALEQYQAPEMKGFKREEVDELIRRRNLEDPRVEYKLASIKLEGRRMHGTFQTSSMHVVLRRQLRLDGKVDTSDPVRRVPVVPSEVVDLRNQGKSMEARFQRLPPHGPSNLADHGPNGYPNQPRGKRDSSDSDDGIDGLVEGLAEIAIVDDDRHGGRYEQGKRKPKRKTRTNTLNRWTYTMRRLIKKRSIECCMGDSSASDGGSERTGLEKENYDVHGHVEMEARQQMDRDAEMESGHTDVADDLLALWTTVPAG